MITLKLENGQTIKTYNKDQQKSAVARAQRMSKKNPVILEHQRDVTTVIKRYVDGKITF